MEAEILNYEGFTIVGASTRIGCDKTHEECPAHWAAFQPQMAKIFPDHRECFGCCSAFQEADETYPQGSFLYTVGFRKTDVHEPDGLDEATIIGGQFAKFLHTGPIGTIGATYEAIWKDWIANNGKWKHRVEPDFERYGYEWNPENGSTEIFIPVDKIE